MRTSTASSFSKSETVDGEEMLANVVDEDEINEVYDLFMEQMMEDEEE